MSQMNVSTIDNPEFINLQPLDVNPLMSKCEIKVLYVGKNRNRSYITKEVATEMSKTLRGAPIVGWYNEEKEDFKDHGDRLTIDGDGIRFESLTKPYGFVAPDAKVWFQKFQEKDDFGNDVTREYLMTTGYLWTGQYEECKSVIENGKPHSMELDENSLQGHWAEDTNSNMEFFIINDAIFSKLCILGDDVEPCFEGSAITAPIVSKDFTLVDDDFKKTLFNMMQELKFALQKGGPEMEKQVIEVTETETKFSEGQDNGVQLVTNENQDNIDNSSTSFTATNADDNKKEKEKKKEDEEKKDDSSKEENKNDEDEKKKPSAKGSLDENINDKYTELESKYSELNNQYESLQETYKSLIEFKNQVEDEKKDELIAKFYMLSDEDKKDVIENKSKYSLSEIESKLSIIYTKKQFSLEQSKEGQSKNQNDDSKIVTYNLNNTEDNVPEWVRAAREVQKQMVEY